VSDYETIQRRRNLIVGVFVIVGLSALGWLIFRFGDLPTVVSKVGAFQVFVQFPTAPGVQKDTPVRFCGYQIGRVTKVMAPQIRADLVTARKYHQTVVVLTIDDQYVDIPSNVEVKLMTRGLGSSYIELKVDPGSLPAPPRDPNRPETCFLVDAMWLQGSTGMTSEFFPEESQERLKELIENLKNFVTNANDIIGDEQNKQNIKETLANLSEASQHVTETMKQAAERMKQAEQTLEEFRKFATTGTKTLKSVEAKAQTLVVSLVQTSEHLSEAASQLRIILEKINSEQGTAGKLISDARLYESLLESNERLQLLLKEIETVVEKIKNEGLRSIY
jgi:phospholipid/cholesterol/gamma-HCH transport system substrate-binding protein